MSSSTGEPRSTMASEKSRLESKGTWATFSRGQSRKRCGDTVPVKPKMFEWELNRRAAEPQPYRVKRMECVRLATACPAPYHQLLSPARRARENSPPISSVGNGVTGRASPVRDERILPSCRDLTPPNPCPTDKSVGYFLSPCRAD